MDCKGTVIHFGKKTQKQAGPAWAGGISGVRIVTWAMGRTTEESGFNSRENQTEISALGSTEFPALWVWGCLHW